MKLILTALSMYFMTGCAVLEPFQSRVVDKGVEYAEKYCEQTDENYRMQLREEFNSKFAGTATIICPE